ncbi:MAG: hypothetical protein ACLQBX_17065 [Candidatus Limnocylindrales bacterium]
MPRRDQSEHDRWIIATQDCDLAWTETDEPNPTIELRPVFTEEPPSDWGIRSVRYRLNDTEYVHGRSPRVMVSPAVLSAVHEHGGHDAEIEPARQRGWKKWLGLRYDRPAVPDELLPLANRIADEVHRPERRPLGLHVRDVLMQFDEESDPVRFSLFAVLESPDDRDRAREWLASIATAVPSELGIADELDARAANGISLHLIETSYAADVAQLTWPRSKPGSEGAE